MKSNPYDWICKLLNIMFRVTQFEQDKKRKKDIHFHNNSFGSKFQNLMRYVSYHLRKNFDKTWKYLNRFSEYKGLVKRKLGEIRKKLIRLDDFIEVILAFKKRIPIRI